MLMRRERREGDWQRCGMTEIRVLSPYFFEVNLMKSAKRTNEGSELLRPTVSPPTCRLAASRRRRVAFAAVLSPCRLVTPPPR